jgi:hypothetical protein
MFEGMAYFHHVAPSKSRRRKPHAERNGARSVCVMSTERVSKPTPCGLIYWGWSDKVAVNTLIAYCDRVQLNEWDENGAIG